MKKICFAASTGGHFEQLMMLRPLMDKYDSFILTEKTGYAVLKDDRRAYYLSQVNRKEKTWLLAMVKNAFQTLGIFLKERPDAVISTGVLSTIPMCLMCKLFGKTVIYIESFAKVTSPTETGKLLYKIADRFYVQWESMQEVYPNAIYKGGIY